MTEDNNTKMQQTQSRKSKYIIIGLVIMISAVAVLIVFLFRGMIVTNENNESISISEGAENLEAPPEQPPQESDMQTTLETGQIITIANNTFKPANLEVTQGVMVVWLNQDKIEHAIKIGAEESLLLKNGEVYAKEFSGKGTYNYECKIHSEMKGTVVVV